MEKENKKQHAMVTKTKRAEKNIETIATLHLHLYSFVSISFFFTFYSIRSVSDVVDPRNTEYHSIAKHRVQNETYRMLDAHTNWNDFVYIPIWSFSHRKVFIRAIAICMHMNSSRSSKIMHGKRKSEKYESVHVSFFFLSLCDVSLSLSLIFPLPLFAFVFVGIFEMPPIANI